MNGFIFTASSISSPADTQGRPLLFTNTYFWLFNLFVVLIIAMALRRERKAGTGDPPDLSSPEEPWCSEVRALSFYLTLRLLTLVPWLSPGTPPGLVPSPPRTWPWLSGATSRLSPCRRSPRTRSPAIFAFAMLS
jgi:hypothetical protein